MTHAGSGNVTMLRCLLIFTAAVVFGILMATDVVTQEISAMIAAPSFRRRLGSTARQQRHVHSAVQLDLDPSFSGTVAEGTPVFGSFSGTVTPAPANVYERSREVGSCHATFVTDLRLWCAANAATLLGFAREGTAAPIAVELSMGFTLLHASGASSTDHLCLRLANGSAAIATCRASGCDMTAGPAAAVGDGWQRCHLSANSDHSVAALTSRLGHGVVIAVTARARSTALSSWIAAGHWSTALTGRHESAGFAVWMVASSGEVFSSAARPSQNGLSVSSLTRLSCPRPVSPPLLAGRWVDSDSTVVDRDGVMTCSESVARVSSQFAAGIHQRLTAACFEPDSGSVLAVLDDDSTRRVVEIRNANGRATLMSSPRDSHQPQAVCGRGALTIAMQTREVQLPSLERWRPIGTASKVDGRVVHVDMVVAASANA